MPLSASLYCLRKCPTPSQLASQKAREQIHFSQRFMLAGQHSLIVIPRANLTSVSSSWTQQNGHLFELCCQSCEMIVDLPSYRSRRWGQIILRVNSVSSNPWRTPRWSFWQIPLSLWHLAFLMPTWDELVQRKEFLKVCCQTLKIQAGWWWWHTPLIP